MLNLFIFSVNWIKNLFVSAFRIETLCEVVAAEMFKNGLQNDSEASDQYGIIAERATFNHFLDFLSSVECIYIHLYSFNKEYSFLFLQLSTRYR